MFFQGPEDLLLPKMHPESESGWNRATDLIELTSSFKLLWPNYQKYPAYQLIYKICSETPAAQFYKHY